jgi:hypothetical protein
MGLYKAAGFSVGSATIYINILPFQLEAISGFEFIISVLVPLHFNGEPYIFLH